METPELVEKEVVDSLKFPSAEVLQDEAERKNREKTLEKALSLGNLDKVKVKIVFEDTVGLKMVHTTIWAISEKNILLKASRFIPRNRIHSISFL